MHCVSELICSECKDNFQTASGLLKHFADHVIQCDKSKINTEKKTMPDLHPILKKPQEEIVPLTLCEVTMTEDMNKPITKKKKYKCTHCNKSFGWSTDLKRHILIHTGERPFKCSLCSLSFTRNFLLQKHITKIHKSKYTKTKIPDLKPIYSVHKTKKKIVKKHINREIIRTPICSN